MSYAEEIYQRNFSVQNSIQNRYEELLPYFKVSHTIMGEARRLELLEHAFGIRDGRAMSIEKIKPYFNSLDIPTDVESLSSFVRFRMNRNSRLVIKHLQDQSPMQEDYQIAIELVKDMLRIEKLPYSKRPRQGVFRKVFDFETFVIKYEYLLGQQDNEIGLWFNKPDYKLCPIDYVSDDQHFIVMPKCSAVLDTSPIAEEYNFDPEGEGLYLDSGAKIWELAEESNWDILDGRYVIVDYGANTF